MRTPADGIGVALHVFGNLSAQSGIVVTPYTNGARIAKHARDNSGFIAAIHLEGIAQRDDLLNADVAKAVQRYPELGHGVVYISNDANQHGDYTLRS